MMKQAFKNEGLIKWEKDRMAWRGQKKQRTGPPPITNIDIDLVVEHIFSQPGKTRLPTNIPLPVMIDILVDFWETDGLYD